MLKALVFTFFKIGFAAGILYWLAATGKLDFSQLQHFYHDPTLVLVALTNFICCTVVLSTWRWRTLMSGAGFKMSWKRAIKLQLTGLFFNSVMPGAVGGDIIRIAYMIHDNPTKSKTQAMMTALLDRIVGLSGLFLISWIMILFNLNTIIALKQLWPVMAILGGVSFGFICFYTAALYHYRRRDPFLKILQMNAPGFRFIEKFYNALRIYRHQPSCIVICVGLSLIIQGCGLLVFYFISYKLIGSRADFGLIAAIYPIGILTTVIPVFPGGLGVGHAAFDQLFKLVGLSGGANSFNLFVLSSLFLNLTGFIPYLSLRRLQRLPKADAELPKLVETR